MTPTLEWYRAQSEYNEQFCERVHVARPKDAHDWKVNALFYSALHRVNYRLAKDTGRAPESHAERNRRVRRELPRVRGDYMDLYAASSRARYCDGFRVTDDRRKSAHALLRRIKGNLPF